LLNKKKLKYIEISEFLKRIGMSQYEKTFLLNGYDDLNFIVTLYFSVFLYIQILYSKNIFFCNFGVNCCNFVVN
jgi:hypothetical protein